MYIEECNCLTLITEDGREGYLYPLTEDSDPKLLELAKRCCQELDLNQVNLIFLDPDNHIKLLTNVYPVGTSIEPDPECEKEGELNLNFTCSTKYTTDRVEIKEKTSSLREMIRIWTDGLKD